MAALTWGQKVELFRDGFTVLRGAVPLGLVERARAAVDGTRATELAAGEKTEFQIINLNKYARKASAVGSDPEITDLFNKSDILPTLREAMCGGVEPAAGAQIALTMPTEPSARCMQSGWPEADIPHRGWAGHLDGVWNGGSAAPQSHDDPDFDEQLFAFGEKGVNGCLRQDVGPGLNLGNYTCLVGVTLSDQSREGCGNLGLLRGAHHRMEEFFRRQKVMGGPLGPGGPMWPRFDRNSPNGYAVVHYPNYVREAFLDGASYTRDGKAWPKPTEVLLSPGDAVVALYHVPHNATRNENPNGSPRYQLYFRVTNSHRDALFQESNEDGAGSPAEAALLNLWRDWEGLRVDLPRLVEEIGPQLRRTPNSSIFAAGSRSAARL